MALQWREEYSASDPGVDRQHKKLFEYVNTLEQVVLGAKQGVWPAKDDVDGLFDFLEAYVNTHFAHEELCFARRRCPAAAKNREAHVKFMELFEDYKLRYLQEGATLSLLEEILSTVSAWLVGHICKIDIQLKQRTSAMA